MSHLIPCKPFNKETLRWKKERKVWLSMFVVPGRSVFYSACKLYQKCVEEILTRLLFLPQ